jgi:putative acetyltransferase
LYTQLDVFFLTIHCTKVINFGFTIWLDLNNTVKVFLLLLFTFNTILIWKIIIRRSNKRDNGTAELIQAVFDEPNIPKVGTAYEDVCWILCLLKNIAKDEHISLWNTMVKVSSGLRLLKMKRRPSELQKVFFLPVTRGLGIGVLDG